MLHKKTIASGTIALLLMFLLTALNALPARAAGNIHKFTYNLNSAVTFETTVTGPERNNAFVLINDGPITVWSGSLMLMAPETWIPIDLKMGDLTIMKSSRFHLTAPSKYQAGSVTFSGQLKKGSNPPETKKAIIAEWKLK